MNAEPRYNDTFYKKTTNYSKIIDVICDKATSLQDLPTPINLKTLFGNAYPIEIEIGFGKGRFLLEASRQNPGINYIGVERAKKYVEITHERFEKYIRHYSINKGSGIFENVRLVWTDANYFLSRYVPEESIQAYHIYFPDPWPKARQQKRRIFRNKEFLSAIMQTLKSNEGRLYVVTDFAEYFSEIQERLAKWTTLQPSEFTGYENIATNFELKYQREGREIFRKLYKKL